MRPRLNQFTATAALVVGLSLSALPAFAQQDADFDKGYAAYESENYKEAFELWEPLAEQGNVEALRNVAQLYRLGLGVQRDDEKAFELYERAAELGSDEAQVNAAFQLLTGKGVERDREAAATWFSKAADQGNPLAQYNLGLMYEKGVGVKKDEEFSLELYRLAAAQGQKRAIARLDALEGDDKTAQLAAANAQAEAEETAKAEALAEEEAEAERAANELAEAKAAEEAAKAEELAKASDEPVLSIKPTPLEFETLDKTAATPGTTEMPAYKPEADQNAEADSRPVVNVVRTPTRKPGQRVADAPKGDEPTPIYIETVTIEKGEESAKSGDAPQPAYVIKENASDQTEPASEGEADTAETEPQPAYVITETASASKSAASTSTSEMRAPSDPVARVKFAETAYRSGQFADAINALAPLADAGMPIAQFWMGRMYNRGEGVDLNRAEAYSLWRSAAAGGSERAATALANLASRLSPDEISIAEQRHAMSGRAR